MLATQVLELMPVSMRIIRGLLSHCLDGSITMNHIRVLGGVDKGYSQAEIASALNVSEAAVSKTIRALMEKKLLKKRLGIVDKRSWDVTLTKEGSRILNSVKKQMKDKLDEKIQQMPKADQVDLSRGLEALDKLMLSLRDEACNLDPQKPAKTKRNK